MDGVHDLGGREGFGRVRFERDQAAFHDPWEARVWGMRLATTRPEGATIDASRHALERLPPGDYLTKSYFERWLAGLGMQLMEAGMVTATEWTTGVAEGRADSEPVPPSRIDPYRQFSYERVADAPPAFKPGDTVVTDTFAPRGHTRLPMYARAKRGVVVRFQGTFIRPDTSAHGEGEAPTHLYAVEFGARELWGPEVDENVIVTLDCFEHQLNRA